MKQQITIIGAGLVGSLWAYLLKKKNFDVVVYEKRPDPEFQPEQGGRSINLIITSRGLYGLQLAGLTEKILPLTMPVYGRGIHQKNGDKLFQPYGRDKSECNYSVSRWELNKALIQECKNIGVKFHFDHSLVAMNVKEKTLSFGSTKVSYERLFATDGAGSVVRKALSQIDPNTYQETTEWLDAGYKELFMPVNKDMNSGELHIWARGTHMMMGLENLDHSYTMTMYLPHKNHEYSFENIKTKEDVERLFQNEFKSAIPFMPNYLQDFLNHPVGTLGTVRFSKWTYKDEIALMGDAAHAIVPFFGQGMNAGFEDCTTLFKLVGDNPNWTEVFETYNKTQKPNADAIAAMALENFVEMRDKVADEKFQFRKKVESIVEKNFPELYRSRYGMITYTLIPYAVAQQAGVKQNVMLDQLSQGLTSPDQVDLAKAKQLLETDFNPWLKAQGFTTDRFLIS